VTWVTHCPDPVGWAERIAVGATLGAGDCWLWQGRLDREGYGRFRFVSDGAKRMTGAHRAAWLALRSDIPPGLVVDHLCRVRRCVNPFHMEIVTVKVNTRRGELRGKVGRRSNPAGQRCGTHGREDGYEYRNPAGYTAWTCRICRRDRVNRWRRRRLLVA
jgi:hypothetical protein